MAYPPAMRFNWALWLLLIQSCWAEKTTVRFDPLSPEVGPFPTDALTVADPAQKTRRRVNLPFPDCASRRSDCADVSLVNQLDGFSLAPRFRVRFSSPIDVDTLRDGVFLIALDNLTVEECGLHRTGTIVPINEVVYDAVTNTAYAKPDNVLDQHRRYALIVTDRVRDRSGEPVAASPEFLRCSEEAGTDPYCKALATLVRILDETAARLGATQRVVVASVFTTMSATTWMEKARDALNNTPTMLRLTQPKSGFAIGDVASIVLRQQLRANPVEFLQDMPVSVAGLTGVDRIVFGSYWSPNFLDEKQQIPTTPTATPVVVSGVSKEVHFHVWLPSSPKPGAGYPVVIALGGITTHRFDMVNLVNVLATEGYAVMAINAVGHGRGPEGKLLITEKGGAMVELPAGGRGVDVDANGVFDVIEGFYDSAGSTGPRDGQRQTVLDVIQLTRAIRHGIDIDANGTRDLDSEHIYFLGVSQGAIHGTLLTALEPSISASVLNVGGGPWVNILRWTMLGFARSLLTTSLAARFPPLTMANGTEHHYVLRDQPPKIVEIDAAIDVQNTIEMMEWIQMAGDPLAYAPHLRASMLPGLPARRVVFQNARDDTWIPNPQGSALIRAAQMLEWSVQFRCDVVRPVIQAGPDYCHRFLSTLNTPGATAVATAAQRQAVGFLRATETCSISDPCIPDVNEPLRAIFGRDIFEAAQPLPERLGFQ